MTSDATDARLSDGGPGAVAVALFVATRPKQWTKNALVFAAPVAAEELTRRGVAAHATVTVVAFVLASAACYLFNDVWDVERDRLHPEKRLRPVASGRIGVRTAIASGLLLLLVAVGLTASLDRGLATALLLTFVASVLVYGAGAKHVPGLELVILASGYVLRPLAGAAATGIPPSGWFVAVCCLGAFTVVLGKRQVELARLTTRAGGHRRALAFYTPTGLRHARRAAAAAMTTAYAVWAFTRSDTQDRVVAVATLALLVAATARLGHLNDRGVGDAPEAVVLSDRWMLAACLGWVALFGIGFGLG